jgi:hypothetical protein
MPGPERTLPGATSHPRFFRSLASFDPLAEAMRLGADPRHLTVESFRLNGEPRLLMHEAPLLNGEAVPAHGGVFSCHRRGNNHSCMRLAGSSLRLFASSMSQKDSRERLPLLNDEALPTHA